MAVNPQPKRGDLEVLEAVYDALGGLVGNAELVRGVAARGNDSGVEALVAQVVQAEVAAQGLVADQASAEAPDRLVLGIEDIFLGQPVFGDAVAKQAAGGRVLLEDRHVVA
jgi:hypothetical protein